MFWSRKETVKYYELFPKLEYDKNFNIINSLGHVFEIIYHRDNDVMRLYTYTNSQLDVLRKDFGVKENAEVPIPNFVGKILFRDEKDFYWGAEFNDFNNFLVKLKPGEQLRLWLVLETRLNDIFLGRSDKLKRNQSVIGKRQREVLASRLEQYAKGNVYYLQPYILSDDKKRVKELAKELEQYILTRSGRLKVEIYKTKKWKDVVPRVPASYAIKIKKWIWIDEDRVGKVAVVPNPSVIPVNFMVGGLLPELPPDRNGFEIGKTIPSGKPYMLELEDLYRHGYIIGGTGAGKTTTITSLITSIKKTYNNAIIMVFDPHGDMAEEVASYFADSDNLFYFHPVESGISINPLALPNLPNREQALLLGFSNVMEIFEKLFGLKDTAVYVRYIIQVSLQLLYAKTPEPTFRSLYEIIYKLWEGEIDLPVDDPTWESKLEMFQEMQEQSFLSAISRLEMLGTNPILLKIFSKTKVDDDELFRPGNVIVINASKASVGPDASFLILAGWLFKTWYYTLVRATLRMERIPIIAFIDEFQNIASLSVIDDILSEARKYGMHVVMAHQHTGQLDKSLIKSIMSNTGVKLLMKEQGDDAKTFAEIFPEFGSELEKILPSLGVGEAVVLITPRKEGDKVVPVRVKINYVPSKKDPEKLKKVIERMQKYVTTEIPKSEGVESLVNPIMKYIEKPNVLEQLILFNVYMSRIPKVDMEEITGEEVSEKDLEHKMYLVDLLKVLGVDRDRVEDAVRKLESMGYISVEKVKNKKLLIYGKGLFGNIKSVAPSDEGRKLAMKVMLKYMKDGYYIAPARQDLDMKSRPDLVALPIDKATLRPLYEKAVAVEVESCNELNTHPEQVVHNFRKESTKDFSEVHSWTFEECFDKLKQLYDQLTEEEKKKVKVFALKTKKKAKEQKEKGVERQEKEVRTETETVKVEPKPEAPIEIQLQEKTVRVYKDENAIEIDSKKYRIPEFDLTGIINMRDKITSVVEKEGKIVVTYTSGMVKEITPLP
jgi:DNA helicase HerA-like ATPase